LVIRIHIDFMTSFKKKIAALSAHEWPEIVAAGKALLARLVGNRGKERNRAISTLPADEKREIMKQVRAEIRDKLNPQFLDILTPLRRQNLMLQRELSKIHTYAYGSYIPGRQDWQARWEGRSGKRVLLFAPVDASGSFYKWTDAINRHTEFAARLVTLYRHKHGYPLDLLLPFPDLDGRAGFKRICDESDIFLVKDEPGFYNGSNLLPPDLLSRWGKPQIFTAHGGYMRKLRTEPEFRRFVQDYDAHLAMTPDLNYEWFRGAYIPHAIDTDTLGFGWTDSRIVAHSPTRSEDPEKKGTHFFNAALAALVDRPDWAGWQGDLITNVSYEDCLARKRRAAIFFDQAGQHTQSAFGVQQVIGWYGNSAIEAMTFGIPTIAHLSPDALDGAERAGWDLRANCPVINVERSADSLRGALLDFARASERAKADLARRTRDWAVDFHGYRSIGERLAAVFVALLPSPPHRVS
jgi:hypothetical protein